MAVLHWTIVVLGMKELADGNNIQVAVLSRVINRENESGNVWTGNYMPGALL